MAFPARLGNRANWAAIALVYAILWLVLDRLGFAPQRDELHFWPTALRFSHSVVPPLGLLKDYGDLNTPLPFMVWGWLEHAFGGGIALGRHFNFLLSAAIALYIGTGRRGQERQAALAALGLLVFPYFLGTATHLYTDVLASFFALAGVSLHLNRRYVAAALAFVLAIASRQYMVVFPAALVACHVYGAWRLREPLSAAQWLAPLAAAASLFGWYLLWGDFGPRVAIDAQSIDTHSVLIHNGLFFLVVIAMYYVIPELVLFRGSRPLTLTTPAWIAFAVLASLFTAYPPLSNLMIAPTFGYTDWAIRLFLPDGLRMVLYFALACLALWRFLLEPLPLILLLLNAAVLTRGHIAWEKYAMPALVVLWYLRSRGCFAGVPRLNAAAAGSPSAPRR